MTPGHFSNLLAQFKNAAKEAAETIYPLRKNKPQMMPSAFQVEATSLKGLQVATEYQLLKSFVRAYSDDSPPPLLVFGDSVFLRVATDDQSPQSLGEILGARYQEDVFQVSGSGYHAGVFEQFSTVLATLPARPLIAIVPINLRSFSPTWDLNPLYQFHAEIELLSSFDLKQPDYRLFDTKPSSELEGRLVPLELDGEKTITLGDFLDTIGESPAIGSEMWNRRLKTIFHYHYMCPMYPKHRKIKSLKQIIRLLIADGVAVYCYVTPINYEAGIEYCGDGFLKAVEKNISIIRREVESVLSAALTGNNALMFRFDDFAFRFARNEFFTLHNATEHLRFEGRDFIARQIAEAERALLKTGTY